MTVAIRDKGPIPLDAPDGKVTVAYDAKTGYVAVAAIDLRNKQFALWWQPSGWVVQRQSYGNVDLTGWQLVVHEGMAKLVPATWGERSPDGKSHLLFMDLAQLY